MTILTNIVKETGAAGVYWNRLYDQASIDRDVAIKSALLGSGLECRSFNASLLVEPWEIRSNTGGPYTVFTPFWRAAQATAGSTPPGQRPDRLVFPDLWPVSDQLPDWRLHPSNPDWSRGFAKWRPGEVGALSQLDRFLSTGLDAYADSRDHPALEHTSMLSPHLAFGEISPRQVWALTQGAVAIGARVRSAETFLKELGWREFNYHVLFHNPEITRKNFKPVFDRFPWSDDEVAFDAWRKGRTGYPIVDAGMRQLWTTGWMHNRVRMVVASFLTKHLAVDWRRGEAWFWDTLVDADLANNVCGWQWVAGSGADAAPYFRIFNPTLQGEKFDGHGDYVRRWVPEISHLANTEIHRPGSASAPAPLDRNDGQLRSYPEPIVDHASARERALDAFRRLTA